MVKLVREHYFNASGDDVTSVKGPRVNLSVARNSTVDFPKWKQQVLAIRTSQGVDAVRLTRGVRDTGVRFAGLSLDQHSIAGEHVKTCGVTIEAKGLRAVVAFFRRGK